MGEFIALNRGNNIFALHILAQHNWKKKKQQKSKHAYLLWTIRKARTIKKKENFPILSLSVAFLKIF